jgi:hypothetical protein
MKKISRSRILRVIIGAACLCASFVIRADAPSIALKHGVYVRDTSPCKDAPNASVLSWDGIGFSGAHSSQCKSRFKRLDATRFQVDTTCMALGDGTPAQSALPDTAVVSRFSNSRFGLIKENQAAAIYRWCSI